MNIYDTKQIRCKDCDKAIGEIEYDAEIFLPKCNQCSNPTPHIKDKMITN
jgi:phage FluMu protein Com|tara:strand:+ start:1717 stop:1866 length:150 start_codon:yes stop_codon:yes gene_type:complete